MGTLAITRILPRSISYSPVQVPPYLCPFRAHPLNLAAIPRNPQERDPLAPAGRAACGTPDTPCGFLGDSYVYGTYGFTEAKEKGRDGTPMAGTSRTPREARPSWARGRHPAGVTARRLITKVKTPFFNDLRGMTSLSIRFDSYWEWAARRVPRPSFHFWARVRATGRECEPRIAVTVY